MTAFGNYFKDIVTVMQHEESTDLSNPSVHDCVTGDGNAPAFHFIWNPTSLAFLGQVGVHSVWDPNGTPSKWGDWAISGGMPSQNLVKAWPQGNSCYMGDPCVSAIGLDFYDTEPPPPVAFDQSDNWNDNASLQLAEAQLFDLYVSANAPVPITFPDWGLMQPNQSGAPGGMGDDPTFITNTYCWMIHNGVPYESYDNINEIGWNSAITITNSKSARLAYQTTFGQGSLAGCNS